MCGFAGVVAWDERFGVDEPTLQRMSAAVAHRGPDGQGIFLAGRRCGLAHRRLAILDPQERANQPMTDGRYHLVFNGEIYNFRELREQLPARHWRTTGDTEVLLAAWSAWGEKCLEKLDGMFAFAVWDQQTGSLFLARDRMGQKPLFYALAPGGAGVAFASELSALRQVPWVDLSVDQTQIPAYLYLGYIPSPRTIFRGVAKLPPAHWVRWDGKAPATAQRYFDPNLASDENPGDEKTAGQTTRQLVLDAVRRQMVSDVPLGCFLSGGIDSSIIAAAMKSAAGADQPVLTYCIGFDDPRYDERAAAAAVARHLGTRHLDFVVRPNVLEDLPKLAEVFGEPFADSSALPTHYLSRQTRQHVKVALSGDGGDELFGGYDRYRAMLLGQRLRPVSGLLQAPARLIPGVHPKSRGARLKRFSTSLRLDPARRYAGYVRLFDNDLSQLLPATNAVEESLVSPFQRLQDAGRDVVEAAMALDRLTYLPEDLLTKLDRCSMLHALEVRSPFMDPQLVRFAAGLKTGQILSAGGGKRMLRQAFAADLPATVFRRKKMGFAVPIGQWFRAELRPMLHDLLGAADSFAADHFQKPAVQRLLQEHQNKRSDHSQRLYALLMLELWWRNFRPASAATR